MSRKCLFAAEAPEVGRRGALVFVKPPGSHVEITTTPEALCEFVKRANRVLDEIAEERPVRLQPLRPV